MCYLVVVEGPDQGAVHHITSSEILLGRDEACDIHLTDRTASRQHSRIVRDGDAFVLEDLESSNGTLLNAQPCSSSKLSKGDKIKIGQTVLLFMGRDKGVLRTDKPHPAETIHTDDTGVFIDGITTALKDSLPTDLDIVVEAWSGLPETVRARILVMVKSSEQEDKEGKVQQG